jgi:uncharacterized membrane protein (DUF106 family)
VFEILEALFDPIFRPLLNLPPFWGILLISFIISLIITICYKFFTDQTVMKQLKAEMKAMQKEMKTLKDKPDKFMAMQKKTMSKNMEYMKRSMKPTLITFLPIIIIFGWLHANFAFIPIAPGQEFGTTVVFHEGTQGSITMLPPEYVELMSDSTQEIVNGETVWKLKAEEGLHNLEFEYGDERYGIEVLVTNEKKYETPLKPIKNSRIKEIRIDHEKLVVLDLFGWQMGWLGAYIIFSIVFSMGMRKLMKLH